MLNLFQHDIRRNANVSKYVLKHPSVLGDPEINSGRRVLGILNGYILIFYRKLCLITLLEIG